MINEHRAALRDVQQTSSYEHVRRDHHGDEENGSASRVQDFEWTAMLTCIAQMCLRQLDFTGAHGLVAESLEICMEQGEAIAQDGLCTQLRQW